MGQRFTQLDSTFETLQNQVDMENQHLTELGQSVRATRDVAAVTCKQVGYIADDQNITNKHVTDLVVNSRQIYNSSCRSGFTCSFKVIPFICRDGSLQSPSDLGLPPLLDRGVIDNLTDHQLDQYLEGYGIEGFACPSSESTLAVFLPNALIRMQRHCSSCWRWDVSCTYIYLSYLLEL
ncbi:hypothetical protein EDD16DRAFT_1642139 [Pisolithus croceorrhizus]|nr:hypothetical protein EDD16DRAFT_1642139 [Pisolithus croceorrhizus]